MKICPNCGNSVDDSEIKCDECGYAFTSEQDNENPEPVEVKQELEPVEESIQTQVVEDKTNKFKLNKKITFIILIAVCAVVVFLIIVFSTKNLRTYNKAMNKMNEQEYSNAIHLFTKLDDYKDSEEKVIECKYLLGKYLYNENEYKRALDVFQDLDYKDSDDYIVEIKYIIGNDYYERKLYGKAVEYLQYINYKDSQEIVDELLDGPYTLENFIARYNWMTNKVEEFLGYDVEKLSTGDVSGNEIITGSGATLTFNQSSEDDGIYVDSKYKITSFEWHIDDTNYSEDSDKYVGEWLCCVAGMDEDITFYSASSLITDLSEESITKDGDREYFLMIFPSGASLGGFDVS